MTPKRNGGKRKHPCRGAGWQWLREQAACPETVHDLGDRRDMHTDGQMDVHTEPSQQVWEKVNLRKGRWESPNTHNIAVFKNKTCRDVTKPDLDVIQENFQRSKKTWIYLSTHGIPGMGEREWHLSLHIKPCLSCCSPKGPVVPRRWPVHPQAPSAGRAEICDHGVPAGISWPGVGLHPPGWAIPVLPRTDFSLVFCPCYCCITSKKRRVAVKLPF